MTDRPLNEYIDLEAYDVVPGDAHRKLIEQLEAITRERDERLAVNVGLIAENTDLKRKLEKHNTRGAHIRLGLSDDALEELGIEVESSPASDPFPHLQDAIDQANTGNRERRAAHNQDDAPASRQEDSDV